MNVDPTGLFDSKNETNGRQRIGLLVENPQLAQPYDSSVLRQGVSDLISRLLLILAAVIVLSGTLFPNNARAQSAQWAAGGGGPPFFADAETACIYNFMKVYGWDYSFTGITYPNSTNATCTWSKNFDNVFFPPTLSSGAVLTCPNGTVPGAYVPGGCAPPGLNGAPHCEAGVGDPINVLSGNLFEEVKDFSTSGPIPLSLTRFYNSQWRDASRLGAGWRTNFDREFSNSGSSVRIVLADGTEALFSNLSGSWQPAYIDTSGNVQSPRVDVSWTLVQNSSGWVFTDQSGTIEKYNSSLQLTSIVYRGGYSQTLSYDTNGNNISVTDSLGRSITFAYTNGLLTSATAPDGRIYQYQYQSQFHYSGPTLPDGSASPAPPPTMIVLSSAIYPAATSGNSPQVNYEYENAAYVTALTGITDQRGIRYATWSYDTNGNATSSQHGGGVDLTTVQYDTVGNTRTVTNALGQQAIYQLVAGQGALLRIASIQGQAASHCAAADTQYGYDSNGFRNQIIDAEGRVTTLVNDNLGNPLSRTEGSGTRLASTTTTSWLSPYPLPVQIIKPGFTNNFSYDGTGRLIERQEVDTTSETVPYSTSGQIRTQTYTYNGAGLLSSVTAGTQATSFTYNSSGYLSSITNALEQITQITSVNGLGQPLAMIDPNGLETDLAYDSGGRVILVTINPSNSPLVTSIGYNAVGDVTSIISPSGANYNFQYDAARRLSAISDAFGDQIQYTRNAMGGIISTRVSDGNGNLVQTSSATFDELNRLLNSIGAAGQTTSYTYDRTDNRTGRTDPLNNQYSFAFDALNRLTSESGPLQTSVSYSYDRLNHLAYVTDPRGLVTHYVYDGFGDMIGQISPDTGMTVKTYDQAGNVISSTDSDGLTTRYNYDALERLSQLTRADGSTATFIWDQSDSAHGAGIGHITHARDTESNTTLDWQYDIYGHVLNKTENVGGYSYATSYTYNSGTGNLQSMILPSGAVVGYAWTNGKVASLTLNNAALISNITYQPFGGPNAWTLANHEVTGRAFDLDGRAVADPLGGIMYDSASHVVQWSPGGESVLSGVRSYGYDALNRLTSYVDPNNNIAYTYDASGNRTSQTVNGTQTSYTIDASSNRLLEASAGESTNTVTAAT